MRLTFGIVAPGPQALSLLGGGGEPAQVADEQQVLEVTADGGEALEVLDRLLAPRLAARAQAGAEQLLEQGRLAIGRGAKHAQVAPADAELRELRGRADDLEVGLVIGLAAVAALGGDDAELLELAQELVADVRLGEQVVAGEGGDGLADRGGAALLALAARADAR